MPTRPMANGDRDDEADSDEEAARQRPSRLAGLRCEVGHGLEARVRQHRERQRERDVRPGRRGPEVDPDGQGIGREEEGEPQADQQEM